MNMFVQNIDNQMTKTTNGMPARISTTSKVLDFFGKVGSLRGHDATPLLIDALAEDSNLTLRALQNLRDCRGGMGERQQYINLLNYLIKTNRVEMYTPLLYKTPELGRWDDLIYLKHSPESLSIAISMFKIALENGSHLCAKWTPRQEKAGTKRNVDGQIVPKSKRTIYQENFTRHLRAAMGLSERRFRKLVVSLSSGIVETALCSKSYDEIDFQKLPSLAQKNYSKAFMKHQEDRYKKYLEDVKNGNAKINAKALFPYDVVKGFKASLSPDLLNAQWNALPNYLNDKKIIAVVDTSESMNTKSGVTKLQVLDLAVALGLYISTKTESAFKNMLINFDDTPKMYKIEGTFYDIVTKCYRMPWGGSTNLEITFQLVLDYAKKFNVPQEDMPEYIAIFSDMQFNEAFRCPSSTAFQMIETMYEEAGYKMPTIIFWNLDGDSGNLPVAAKDRAVLCSGSSPSLLKSFLTGEPEKTAYENMLDVLMQEKYTI